jgi:hypothetical protein
VDVLRAALENLAQGGRLIWLLIAYLVLFVRVWVSWGLLPAAVMMVVVLVLTVVVSALILSRRTR